LESYQNDPNSQPKKKLCEPGKREGLAERLGKPTQTRRINKREVSAATECHSQRKSASAETKEFSRRGRRGFRG